MNCLRLFAASFGVALLLSGCGNTDAGKDSKQKPADQGKPDEQTPKKDGEKKHSHEAS